MSYTALARKWRPQTFDDFIGQEHVHRALQNALARKHIHHAYLFTGTRGVGKTTIARLFAKALSCSQGISTNPCGQCSACQAIKAGNYLDLIEIDAASRTKIEDTRELLDQVSYPPVNGRFKIYLIDEVHMLSTHSFNALLKTLEEPPAQTKFLLATTDPQKLPITIQSRCLQLHLQHVSSETIAQHLGNVLTKEHINYQPQTLDILAQAASGSIRDALSLLEQALTLSPHNEQYQVDTLAEDSVTTMLGTLKTEQIHMLLVAIQQQDHQQITQWLAQRQQQNINYHAVLEQILQLLYLHLQHKILKQSTEYALTIDEQQCHLYIQFTLKTQQELDLFTDHHMGLSMLVMRMLAFKLDQNNLGDLITEHTQNLTPIKNPTVTPPQTTRPASTPSTTPTANAPKDWAALSQQLRIKGLAGALFAQCSLLSDWDASTWTLEIPSNQKSLASPAAQKTILAALQQHIPTLTKIAFSFQEANTENKAPTTKQRAPAQTNTAPKPTNDPVVNALQDKLQATLISQTAIETETN